MSAEHLLESILIALLNKDETLAAITPRHHDDDTENTSPSITVSAIKGEEQLEGPKGHMYEARIAIRSNEPDAATLTDLAARVDTAIETPDTADVDLSAFTYLVIYEETGGDREKDQDTRSRTRTFPIHATLA